MHTETDKLPPKISIGRYYRGKRGEVLFVTDIAFVPPFNSTLHDTEVVFKVVSPVPSSNLHTLTLYAFQHIAEKRLTKSEVEKGGYKTCEI